MQLRSVFTFFLLSITAHACVNDCHLVDCGANAFFNVVVLDKVTNESLLGDTSDLYNIENMTISSTIIGETIKGSVVALSPNQENLNRLGVIVNVDPSIMFLKLNETDTDTLRFIHQSMESECCSWYQLDSVSINGGLLVAIENDLITILK